MPDNMVKYAVNTDISRMLTGGETRLAYAMFGTTLRTQRVRVHNYRYLPWQSEGIAMTPNGELYFHPNDYK